MDSGAQTTLLGFNSSAPGIAHLSSTFSMEKLPVPGTEAESAFSGEAHQVEQRPSSTTPEEDHQELARGI